MQVSQERLERVLGNVYNPECVYLKKADLDLLKATGKFEVGRTFYTKEPLEHLADAEAKICLNQLAYVAFAEWIDRGEFEGINIEFEEYLALMKEKMYIVESSIKFKEPIDTSKPFEIAMQVRRHLQVGKNPLVYLDYKIAGGKAEGKIGLSLVLK
jgi:hypothetical protein